MVIKVTAELKTSAVIVFPRQLPLNASGPSVLCVKGALARFKASLREFCLSSSRTAGSASLKGLPSTLVGGLPGKRVKMDDSGGNFGIGGVGTGVRVCTGGGSSSSSMLPQGLLVALARDIGVNS